MAAILSSDDLMEILRAIDAQKARLERLHWAILPFLPDSHDKTPEKNKPICTLINMQLQTAKLDKAREAVSKLYTSQFPNENEIPVGDSGPVSEERQAST